MRFSIAKTKIFGIKCNTENIEKKERKKENVSVTRPCERTRMVTVFFDKGEGRGGGGVVRGQRESERDRERKRARSSIKRAGRDTVRVYRRPVQSSFYRETPENSNRFCT